jgi:tetratricopeptide (TPR) repeat protein
MASSARIDELKKKFDENPRRYFAPLANEFRKGGDLEQAILICEEFLPQQPGHMSGHIVYGQTLFESGRLDESRTVFETALSLDPENLIALRHLGDIAGRQGDPGSARRWYERVLEADPRNDEIQVLITALDNGQPAPSVHEHAHQSTAWQDEQETVSPSAASDGELMPIDLDETMPHGVPIVSDHTREAAAYTAPSARDDAPFDSLSVAGIVPMPETAELMPEVEPRADGFEATEFSAPESPVLQADGLQSAFEEETGIYGAATPLPGLESSPSSASDHEHPELPALEEDDGFVLPPHGDPIAERATVVETAGSDFPLLDSEFVVPTASSGYERESSYPVASDTELDSETFVPDASPVGSALPVELPPEVIAAEAELIDAGMSIEQPGDSASFGEQELEPDNGGSELSFIDTQAGAPAAELPRFDEEEQAAPAPVSHQPFVTETMAELYLKQGFREQALAVYVQLSDASPKDARLADKVVSLRAQASAPVAATTGPNVRDFFARIAALRPGERGAAAAPPDESDFASDVAAPEPVAPSPEPPPIPASAAHLPSAVERTAASQPGGGTIDALFGNRPIGTSEDSAAAALAQAFGASSEVPQITGHPARQASGELSLDSVFRDGPSRGSRASQGFSFDQFFSQNTEGDKTSGRTSQEVPLQGEPAEKSADDIEQFNSWLQGLKNR